MYNKIISNASIFITLQEIDKDLADQAHLASCPNCGDKLDRGNYQRKTRGIPDLQGPTQTRHSLCCRGKDCRKRTVVPSVLFYGRFVYSSLTLLLISYFLVGGNFRVRKIQKKLNIDRRTLLRWKKYWSDYFPYTPLSKIIQSRFPSLISMPKDLIKFIEHHYPSSEFISKLVFVMQNYDSFV
jgi:hypothetical protein